MKGLPMRKSISFLIITLFAISLFGLQFIQAQDVTKSSQGEQIAFIRNGNIWLMNPDGSNQRPLVDGIGNARGRLTWSPDGKRVAFSRQGRVQINYPEGGGGLYNTESQEISKITLPKAEKSLMALMPTVSPDGSKVCFVLAEFVSSQMKQLGLAVVPVNGAEPSSEDLLAMAEMIPDGTSPAWSPDGKKIAFLKNDGVYYANVDFTGEKLVTHPDEGLWVSGIPCWSPNSDKVAFCTSNGSIYTVNLDGTGMKMISGPGNDSNPAWSK
jgi:TolB protein